MKSLTWLEVCCCPPGVSLSCQLEGIAGHLLGASVSCSPAQWEMDKTCNMLSCSQWLGGWSWLGVQDTDWPQTTGPQSLWRKLPLMVLSGLSMVKWQSGVTVVVSGRWLTEAETSHWMHATWGPWRQVKVIMAFSSGKMIPLITYCLCVLLLVYRLWWISLWLLS